MRDRIFLLALILNTVNLVVAQTIEGFVLDGKTGEPIVNASVYIDGSTMGVISKENGHFSLEYDEDALFTLVVSHLGYKTFKTINPNTGEPLKIYLREDIESLKAALVVADPWSWEKRLKEFKLHFLGETKGAESCNILNEDDLVIRYDPTENILTASSMIPIVINNDHLGYNLVFDLKEFKVVYRDTQFEEFRVMYTEYNGTVKFEDLLTSTNKEKERWVNNRQMSYAGSILHFMRTLYNGRESYATNKFKLINQDSLVIKDNFHGSVDNLQRFKEVSFENKLVVLYNRSYRTLFKLRDPIGFTIDKFGNYRSGNNVIIEGNMTIKRVGEMLPFDYDPSQFDINKQ